MALIEAVTGARDPGFPRQPDRRSGGAPRRRNRAACGRALGRLDRRLRGVRAARRRQGPLRRQGRARRPSTRSWTSSAPRSRASRRASSASSTRSSSRPTTPREQVPHGRQRDPRRQPRGREGRGGQRRSPSLPLPRRPRTRTSCPFRSSTSSTAVRTPTRASTSRSSSSCRTGPTRCGGAALGHGDLPRAQVRAQGRRLRDGPRRRGRLRARSPQQPRGPRLPHRGDREGRLHAGRPTSLWGSTSSSSEFFENGSYRFEGKDWSAAELTKYYEELLANYPLVSIEDASPRMTGRAGRRSPTTSAEGAARRRRPVRHQPDASRGGHPEGRRELPPRQGEPDRHAVRDARRGLARAALGLHPRCSRTVRGRPRTRRSPTSRSHERGSDQERRARTQRARSRNTISFCASKRSWARPRSSRALRFPPIPRLSAPEPE